jgi:phosphohistidine phosphatase
MKTLLILRHAKSDWGDVSLPDFDRPLNKRGRADAPLMGGLLPALNLVPDHILASPAERVKETLALVTEAAEYAGKIQWVEDFYGGTALDMLTAVRALPHTVNQAMLVGHNPILEEMVSLLCSDDAVSFGVKLSTATLAHIELSAAHWAGVSPGGGMLKLLLPPKVVKAMG